MTTKRVINKVIVSRAAQFAQIKNILAARLGVPKSTILLDTFSGKTGSYRLTTQDGINRFTL